MFVSLSFFIVCHNAVSCNSVFACFLLKKFNFVPLDNVLVVNFANIILNSWSMLVGPCWIVNFSWPSLYDQHFISSIFFGKI